jgi:hypothetical protein
MGRLQNNPSIGWVQPKSAHARPLTWGNKDLHIKVICKVRKRRHRNPLFGHIGHEISKNRSTGLEWGMKLSLAANLVRN